MRLWPSFAHWTPDQNLAVKKPSDNADPSEW
jgi:hypothetical protein